MVSMGCRWTIELAREYCVVGRSNYLVADKVTTSGKELGASLAVAPRERDIQPSSAVYVEESGTEVGAPDPGDSLIASGDGSSGGGTTVKGNLLLFHMMHPAGLTCPRVSARHSMANYRYANCATVRCRLASPNPFTIPAPW